MRLLLVAKLLRDQILHDQILFPIGQQLVLQVLWRMLTRINLNKQANIDWLKSPLTKYLHFGFSRVHRPWKILST
jgi:hypothetical protein